MAAVVQGDGGFISSVFCYLDEGEVSLEYIRITIFSKHFPRKLKIMIIGISGKIGSDKDTVGKIIQYITWCETANSSDLPDFETWCEHFYVVEVVNHFNNHVGWEIKKYAAKLKQIAALLTGCSVKDLEDPDFKNKQLPTEWMQEYKDVTWGELTEIERSAATYMSGQKYRRAEKWLPTYRWLLQQLGTDAMRDKIHINTWINALFADYRPLDPEQAQSMGNVLDYTNCKFPKWIITDMRFPNELEAVKSRKGITIRINRTKPLSEKVAMTADGGKSSVQMVETDFSSHPSETALDNANFDYVIENNGTIGELIVKVEEILTHAGLLPNESTNAVSG
jgi:hypothetical protein